LNQPDLIVVGGGISGLSIAWKAAQAGRKVLVLEANAEVGGCICTRRFEDGFWLEIGAHTVYNSYCRWIEMATAAGCDRAMLTRGPARALFGLLRDGTFRWLTPPKVLLELDWLTAAVHLPVGLFRDKRGLTIEEYFSSLLGRGNFRSVLSPILSAVPSQTADLFPAEGPGSLFKKRPRNQGFPRHLGFEGGLQTVCNALASQSGITTWTGVDVKTLEESSGGFAVHCSDGRELGSARVALAAPCRVTADLLRNARPNLAQIIDTLETVEVESVGTRLPRAECWMPECAFLIPTDDAFFSAVTRDPFPDPDSRAFTFHFRPGLDRIGKLQRMSEVLRVDPDALADCTERRVTLPSPRIGHAAIVAAVDHHLEGSNLAITGNYFAGLAIEDCIARSWSEWDRIA